jgi:hypothetical protein
MAEGGQAAVAADDALNGKRKRPSGSILVLDGGASGESRIDSTLLRYFAHAGAPKVINSRAVFVSYASEGEAQNSWVLKFATDLTNRGLLVTLDRWDVAPGSSFKNFMDRSIANADYILFVCTPKFIERANNHLGGVGYEYQEIVGKYLSDQKQSVQCIPIRRFPPGDNIVLPNEISDIMGYDFHDDEIYANVLQKLVEYLFGQTTYRPSFDASPFGFMSSQPKGWILIAGTGVEWRIDKTIERTSRQLGERLADEGYGIITGGWPGVDKESALAFANRLTNKNVRLSDRLIQIVRKGKAPAFLDGIVKYVDEGEAEWLQEVKLASAIVLIAGVGGTERTGRYGLENNIPVFPLKSTGGDAQKIYDYMENNWSSRFIIGIELTEFRNLEGQAPEVFDRLIPMLNKITLK